MQKFDGKALRREREMRNKRREDLAVALNRSYENIRAYETGRTDPPASVLASLADVIGCDPGAFFTEDNDDAA